MNDAAAPPAPALQRRRRRHQRRGRNHDLGDFQHDPAGALDARRPEHRGKPASPRPWLGLSRTYHAALMRRSMLPFALALAVALALLAGGKLGRAVAFLGQARRKSS